MSRTRFNPPSPGGAGAVLKAAVLGCGMLRAITRQPVPVVPVVRLRLGCGGSAYRLTWGRDRGFGRPPCTLTRALPTPPCPSGTLKHPAPWGQQAGRG